ncbi:SnoaL-like domain protein [Roseovarius sp. THAF9]|uniref:nuclear transport factor 2 family protein n=1 Tax=Roseovarius sp. THAF9 TaxID=2587847 RepID=UPI0012688332|nr:nuclear transport factor 2 family protein [Roseovarius sp. THAF9]QFT92370.1 SnoaL-like domain protein [Roseovarius sp. THAF9]
MTEDHPAIAVLRQFDPSDMAASAPLFAEDAVWHYFNPNLPELQGDHVGREAIGAFFAALAEKSRGTFRIEPVSATPVGPELVVVQSRNTLTLGGRSVTVDVVVVWRIVADRVLEVWDIVPGQPTEVRDATDCE